MKWDIAAPTDISLPKIEQLQFHQLVDGIFTKYENHTCLLISLRLLLITEIVSYSLSVKIITSIFMETSLKHALAQVTKYQMQNKIYLMPIPSIWATFTRTSWTMNEKQITNYYFDTMHIEKAILTFCERNIELWGSSKKHHVSYH